MKTFSRSLLQPNIVENMRKKWQWPSWYVACGSPVNLCVTCHHNIMEFFVTFFSSQEFKLGAVRPAVHCCRVSWMINKFTMHWNLAHVNAGIFQTRFDFSGLQSLKIYAKIQDMHFASFFWDTVYNMICRIWRSCSATNYVVVRRPVICSGRSSRVE